MSRFVYEKDNGDESERNVIPIGYIFGERDKVLCIDVTDFMPSDFDTMKELHDDFLESIKDNGYGERFRSFFVDGITEVIEE